jgi:hypothetical protein
VPITNEQWAEARALRAEGASYNVIASRFGIPPKTVAARAPREGWAAPAAARHMLPPGPASGMHRDTVRRFYRMMNMQSQLMEISMEKKIQDVVSGKTPAAEVEEQIREFGTMVKNVENLSELSPEHAAAEGARSADAEARASEAEAFRREIAERIEKLIPPA